MTSDFSSTTRLEPAPSQSDVVAVQQWLRGAGFTVVDTPSNNHYVAVEGTVAQAQSAFGTTLGAYSAYGMTLRAPETAPSGHSIFVSNMTFDATEMHLREAFGKYGEITDAFIGRDGRGLSRG